MLKGRAELIISHATIIAAVQKYLDDEFATGEAPEVKSVKPTNQVNGSCQFLIELEEPKSRGETP